MFVDTLIIQAKAGDGGPGVVRWSHEKYKPRAGPSGGDGGRGGDIFIEGVANNNALRKYVGATVFRAPDGETGQKKSQEGHRGVDVVINVPIGSKVTDTEHDRVYEVNVVGERIKILEGGRGGRGNEHFKSATNRSPEQSTPGTKGESATFVIEVTLAVTAGLIGLPNAGKSSLLNSLTNASSKIGAFPFTTTEPHLGDFYGFTIADIPGLIEGAADGKGLGHKFLRHITKTKMLAHLISLESDDVLRDYYTIRNELTCYEKNLGNKEEWIILSKKDLINEDLIAEAKSLFDNIGNRVFVISTETGEGLKFFQDALVEHLRTAYNT